MLVAKALLASLCALSGHCGHGMSCLWNQGYYCDAIPVVDEVDVIYMTRNQTEREAPEQRGGDDAKTG